MGTFSRLNRSEIRSLRPGEKLRENGIEYVRLEGDGRWSVNVMVNRARHHIVVGLESEGFTRTQAEEVIARLKAKKRERGHGVSAPRHQVRLSIASGVNDYLDYLRTHGGRDLASKSIRFTQHIVPHLGHLAMAALSDDDWSRYVAMRVGEGAAASTINRERSALLHLLNTAVRRKLLPHLPCHLQRQKEPPGKIVYLTPEQAQRLVTAAENDQSRHALPFVMIALFTGMRQSPVLNLRVRDIDCDRRVLWIGKDKAGRREQPMPASLASYLAELVAGRAPDDYVFASRRAGSGRVYQINSIFRRCVERAGLPASVTPHTMRHTMASNAAHAGLDAATIQGLGGWKTRAMAERYSHAANLATAMDALESRLQGRTVTPELQQPAEKLA